ncbi:uncharacterized protein LOC132752537 [Ruditapes philippinarum]|uniref:uncharacterized protein LOC132752537 n=1 Tax=Ruditapes philippinarum TaxID=129788 RepID=UPI00295AB3DB|nr:uncharacterized protein LOC132752537 [Ruditapes philippinarum]
MNTGLFYSDWEFPTPMALLHLLPMGLGRGKQFLREGQSRREKFIREGRNRRKQFFRKGRNKRDQLKTVKESTYICDILELGNLGIRQFDEPFWIKKNGRTNVDGLFENWFRTEERRHVVVQDDAQKEREKLIDNHAELISGLDDAEKGFGQSPDSIWSREFYEEELRTKTNLDELLETRLKTEGRKYFMDAVVNK